MNGGPLHLSFKVYSDFKQVKWTKDTVYHKSSSATKSGGHAVKLIGYGKDSKGRDYWLCANSWGAKWGVNGYFKIEADPSYVAYSVGYCDPSLSLFEEDEFMLE